MIRRMVTSVAAATIGLLPFAAALSAQPATPPLATEGVISLHHQKLYQLMKDMTRVMGAMTEQMSHSIISPEQQAEMSQRMAAMAGIMQRMAGLEARPAMNEADWQKKMDEMRTQMDDMLRDWQMAPDAK